MTSWEPWKPKNDRNRTAYLTSRKSFPDQIRDQDINHNTIFPFFPSMRSDPFLPGTESWRLDFFNAMRQRPDIQFYLVTNFIVRAYSSLPGWLPSCTNISIGIIYHDTSSNRKLPILQLIPGSKFILVPDKLTNLDLPAITTIAGSIVSSYPAQANHAPTTRRLFSDLIINQKPGQQ